MRKRRTREHVIADLSVNHVERQVLLCGWAVERFQKDYGLDLVMTTYSADGQFQNGPVYLQVKATDHLQQDKREGNIRFRVAISDLEWWLEESSGPVILIVYDARRDAAYWLHIQSYFADLEPFELSLAGAAMTVTVPLVNHFDVNSLQEIAAIRDRLKQQQKRTRLQ